MHTGAYETALHAAQILERTLGPAPPVAVVLGSGLGDFAEGLADAKGVPYGDVPGFPPVGVEGHAGRLVVGSLPGPDGQPARVAALAGRAHLYEGHEPVEVVCAVRALWLWGVRALMLTNAAGGIREGYRPGDLMSISDHINLSGYNPLRGHNEARFGPRFPDMSAAYDPDFRRILKEAATELGVRLHEGVYVGLAGPSYETPAEIRMLRTVGGDAVGMSTVVEVIAARHCGLRVAGVSCITNLAAGLGQATLSHDEVKETALQARAGFIGLLSAALPRFAVEVTR